MTMTSIKFKVTREDSVPTSGGNSSELFTPHLLAPRNSLTSATGGFKAGSCSVVLLLAEIEVRAQYSIRRRRPMTLKIMPRLSLPTQSTSAPTSTTDSEWPPVSDKMCSTKLEVQKEIQARLEQDHRRREHMLSVRGNRSCSEQGPHPGYHLWGTRRSRKRTSAPQMGTSGGMRTALILRSRRSWPVAPVASTR
ncbi:unnamed protein product [Brassicogethes aeneus]|uniref:Uncharacterized protein n=1 Tax=Brassicogethes aeneus TaxID=1431903 RepID=A0A9P0B5I3_BRAAE|nr:unnamed protein product [Brassicogethes aeneus]